MFLLHFVQIPESGDWSGLSEEVGWNVESLQWRLAGMIMMRRRECQKPKRSEGMEGYHSFMGSPVEESRRARDPEVNAP
jgi:hypothetical protein